MNLRSILKALFLAGLLAMAPSVPSQPSVEIEVDVALSSTTTSSSGLPTYLLDDPSGSDPIDVTIGVKNVSGGILNVDRGFSARPFDKDLVFIAPDGRQVRANSLKNSQLTQTAPGEPADVPPPRVCRIGSTLVQCAPVEELAADFDIEFPGESTGQILNARNDFTFDQTGYWKVKTVVAISSYSEILTRRNNVPFARVSAGNPANVRSDTEAFALTGDGDGDGFSWSPDSPTDCDDTDPAVNPGAAEVLGNGKDDDCNPDTPDQLVVDPGPDGVIEVSTRQLTLSPGDPPWRPQVTKGPIVGMEVRFYDRTGACVSNFSASWQHFRSIWVSCVTSLRGETDNDGLLSISLPPGTYQVIGKIPNDEVYVGKERLVESELTTPVHLFFLEKENGRRVSGRWRRFTGSDLMIIEPEYVEWEGGSETYPFVFDSVGDWTVTTSVTPPEGFVSDQNAIISEVNSELQAVQFTITDVGSEWVGTDVEYDILHAEAGKVKRWKVKDKIGVKLSKKLAREKGLSVWGKEPPGLAKKFKNKALNKSLTTEDLKKQIRNATKSKKGEKSQ